MSSDTVVGHVFFRPDEVARERTHIPSELFNRCRLMLNRCGGEYAIVPVPAMQYQAVIEAREIFFVDNLAYAVRGGEGGKLIMLAWENRRTTSRDSLTEPVPIELVYYRPEIREVHRRLMSEFPKALGRAEQRMRETDFRVPNRRVLPFGAH